MASAPSHFLAAGQRPAPLRGWAPGLQVAEGSETATHDGELSPAEIAFVTRL